jgi:hypothetical protein
MSDALTRGQKMFNQRLLAEHCIPETRAREIWKEIASSNENEGMGADSYGDSLAQSNEQLKYCGLEIVAVSIKKEGEKPESHYAIVNMFPDEVAKKSFLTTFHAHQYAYVRLALEKLVEGPASRSTLINLRNDLEDAHKLALDPTEKALEKLLDEKWIEESEAESRKSGSMSIKISLAPRAYMELSYLLVAEFGMSEDDLPQKIFHRL